MNGTSSRKTPKLRVVRGKYYCIDVYLPDGKRTTIGFGTSDERTEGQILVAFGKWLDLYHDQPHKVLAYDSPFEAVEQILNPSQDVTVGELLDKYSVYASRALKKSNRQKDHPDRTFLKRVRFFLEPYKNWPIRDFGPDELLSVQRALVEHRYKRGKHIRRYTRRGVNDNVNWIRRIWKWGMGRHFVSAESVQAFEEVKPLSMGRTDAPDTPKRARITREELDKVIKTLTTVVA